MDQNDRYFVAPIPTGRTLYRRPNALRALAETNARAEDYLACHCAGDYGAVGTRVVQVNDQHTLNNRRPILSLYPLPDGEFLVIETYGRNDGRETHVSVPLDVFGLEATDAAALVWERVPALAHPVRLHLASGAGWYGDLAGQAVDAVEIAYREDPGWEWRTTFVHDGDGDVMEILRDTGELTSHSAISVSDVARVEPRKIVGTAPQAAA